jgi:hypothetical protein
MLKNKHKTYFVTYIFRCGMLKSQKLLTGIVKKRQEIIFTLILSDPGDMSRNGWHFITRYAVPNTVSIKYLHGTGHSLKTIDSPSTDRIIAFKFT